MKRIAAIIFAISALTASPVEARQTPKAPAWLVKRVEEGKRCKRYEPLMRKHGLPVTWFTYICARESGQNRLAHNEADPFTGSYGLWQINGAHTSLTFRLCGGKWGDLQVLFNPECNVRVTKFLFDEYGLIPWGFKGF